MTADAHNIDTEQVVGTQIAYRTQKDISILNTAPLYTPLSSFGRLEGNLRCSCYSPDGLYFAWASPERVAIVNAADGLAVTNIPISNVFEIAFSPLGTYISTWQRPSKDNNGLPNPNMKVWLTKRESTDDQQQALEPLAKFIQRSQTGWNLQYTADEELCARLVTNEIQFYLAGQIQIQKYKLRVEGVTDFSVCPGKVPSVAVFVPKRNGNPATIKLFKIPDFDAPTSQEKFFNGDKVQFKWNSSGTDLIVLAQTDIDKSNMSYYGQTYMFILSIKGGFHAKIHLDKEGPIHDVSWSPNSKEFGVVYGFIPSKTTIFNAKGTSIRTLNPAPRNTISFSPHARFAIVAGFGNLAGKIDIYDLLNDFRKISTIEASNTTVCSWSPDGIHILTATTSPRLRVDNGIRIWHVSGQLMYNKDLNELYQVDWRPIACKMFTIPEKFQSRAEPHPSATAYLSTIKKSATPAGAYRPPGARGLPLSQTQPESESENARSSSDVVNPRGGKFRTQRHVPDAALATSRLSRIEALPPGAALEGGVSLSATGSIVDEGGSKAALKNKKKREARRAKEAALGKTDKEGSASRHSGIDPRTRREILSNKNHGARGRSEEKDARVQICSRDRDTPSQDGKAHSSENNSHTGRRISARKNDSSSTPDKNRPGLVMAKEILKRPESEQSSANVRQAESLEAANLVQDKKMRSLVKKLRAIEELKLRQASGQKLEETQVQKIATEDVIRQELGKLGYDE